MSSLYDNTSVTEGNIAPPSYEDDNLSDSDGDDNEFVNEFFDHEESRLKAQEEERIKALGDLLEIDDNSSDDDEEDVNTIGRVPLHWYGLFKFLVVIFCCSLKSSFRYDEHDHIGYDKDGNAIAKAAPSRLQNALLAQDDPDLFARTFFDPYNGKEVVLSKREMEVTNISVKYFTLLL